MNKLKNFNALNLILPVILSLTFTCAAQAQVDLYPGLHGSWEGLFVMKANINSVNTNRDKFVAKGETMELKKNEAKICEGDTCVFNIGFFVDMKDTGAKGISTYILLIVEKGSQIGKTVHFPPISEVLPLRLRVGANKVKFAIDPDNKIAETNERNNSLSVTFIVEPTLIVIPGKKNKPKDGKP